MSKGREGPAAGEPALQRPGRFREPAAGARAGQGGRGEGAGAAGTAGPHPREGVRQAEGLLRRPGAAPGRQRCGAARAGRGDHGSVGAGAGAAAGLPAAGSGAEGAERLHDDTRDGPGGRGAEEGLRRLRGQAGEDQVCHQPRHAGGKREGVQRAEAVL